jgi:dipeptidyl aminopeptidase/acylaminoacyl peptidase
MKKLLFAFALTAGMGAQGRAPFTLDQLLSYPFPDNLVASPIGSTIAWVFNERGVRNIYSATGSVRAGATPTFTVHKVTPYGEDDGQELTYVSFSPDGKSIVYVRGGDHGSNWPAEGNLMPDPNSSPVQPKMQVWAVAAAGGSPKLLGEGDAPVVSPSGGRVAFVKDHRIWVAPIDGSKAAEPAFFAKGTSESPAWSPDGATLAFVSNRDDHSFIGLFTDSAQPIRYIAPSTSRDSEPRWSADGKSIVFVRQPGRGGVPKPPLVPQPAPWSLWVGRTDALSAKPTWKSGHALMDSISRIAGGVNLHWAADDTVVYLSYQDGWPHLYSIQRPEAGGMPKLLTPGPYMVEYMSLTPDGRFAVYNANAGPDPNDVDRRHIFKVPVDGSTAPVALTSGKGIEWAPAVTADGRTVAFLASTAQRTPLPEVVSIDGGPRAPLAEDHVPSVVRSAPLVAPEPVTFRSSDGVEVHGQLFKTPAGPARRPALVYVHGGPPRQMLLGWHYMDYYANDYGANQYLASRGFVVLSVNYRLGIGYGYKFHNPEHGGARGAEEYLDVVAGGKWLQARSDVDPRRIGIWGGSYGGYLTALALGRNSDVFAAGVDIHGLHNWDRFGRGTPNTSAAMAGDGITESDLREAARVAYQSSPVSSVKTWKSPVLLIHADDDRNVEFHQTVDLKQRLVEQGVTVDELVIPDDIHDFLLWRTWIKVTSATGEYFERIFLSGPSSSFARQ